MFKAIPIYDDKYCACKILVPQELSSMSFPSLQEGLHQVYALLRPVSGIIKKLQCSPPVFVDYNLRAYADALKPKEYVFDKLELIIVGAEWVEGRSYVAIDCVTNTEQRFKTTILFNIVSEEDNG